MEKGLFNMSHSNVVVGITGASGAIYGVRTVEELAKLGLKVHVIITKNGKATLSLEVPNWLSRLEKVSKVLDVADADIFISGSKSFGYLVIAPCTINTLVKASLGIADNNLLRTIQVAIKEGLPTLLLVREMPWPPQAFEAAYKLSLLGVKVVPASPPFYGNVKTIEDLVNNVVGRVLKLLGFENNLYKKWRD